MTAEEREKLRKHISNWNDTNMVLERLRRLEIRNSKLAESIAAFDNALRSALWLRPAEPTSGLVEFHKILAKTR